MSKGDASSMNSSRSHMSDNSCKSPTQVRKRLKTGPVTIITSPTDIDKIDEREEDHSKTPPKTTRDLDQTPFNINKDLLIVDDRENLDIPHNLITPQNTATAAKSRLSTISTPIASVVSAEKVNKSG